MSKVTQLPTNYEDDTSLELRDDLIPQPKGWQILISPYKAKNKSAGGIVLPDDVGVANKHLNMVGCVIAMGELCYTDGRFGVGERDPKEWCHVGDWVLYGQNIGTRFSVYDDNNELVEFLLLNDDNIKAVIDDPRTIRAYV